MINIKNIFKKNKNKNKILPYTEYTKYKERYTLANARFIISKNKYKAKEKGEGWSDWDSIDVSFIDIYDSKRTMSIYFRYNYKKVQIKCYSQFGYKRFESSCNLKLEEFDVVKGVTIAYMRMYKWFINKQLDYYITSISLRKNEG